MYIFDEDPMDFNRKHHRNRPKRHFDSNLIPIGFAKNYLFIIVCCLTIDTHTRLEYHGELNLLQN